MPISSYQLPAKIADAVETARLPESYARAKRSLAECERIDECSDWADRMAALASYARQADDVELENYARRIRARAVRRCGELLLTFYARGGNRSKNGIPPIFAPSRAEAAAEARISPHKGVTAVRIARIPQEDFESLVELPRPPGTTLLAQIGKVGRPPAERVSTITGADMDDMVRQSRAGQVLEELLRLASIANFCDMGTVVELLLDEKNVEKLPRIRDGILFAARLGSALDQARPSKKSILKVVE